MDIRAIKNDRLYFWTNHSKFKLLQYGLSPTAVKNVINKPERKEVGIAPNTTAVMKRKDGKKMKRELWVMIQKHGTWSMKHETKKDKIKPGLKIHPVEYPALRENFAKRNLFHRVKIISAWIYPGVSPKGKDIYIPEDALAEIENLK
jgi:hypothetical protein